MPRKKRPHIQHYGKVEKSKRLQRFLTYMKECAGSPKTKLEIFLKTRIMDVPSCKSELRYNGWNIMRDYAFTTGEGTRVHKYWLPVKNQKIKDHLMGK